MDGSGGGVGVAVAGSSIAADAVRSSRSSPGFRSSGDVPRRPAGFDQVVDQ